ncbi:MAG: hypothetical protein HYZ14_08900 [Bacteroidetes bacterium]|nr:hypothetical protein [Bacteroidota bacterium]
MERELKLVISFFLIYLVYGITSLVNTQTLIAPVFLSPFIFVSLAVFFAILNRKQKQHYALILYAVAFTFFALTDEFVMGLLTRAFGSPAYELLTTTAAGILTFLVFFGFLAFAVYFFYRNTKQKIVSVVLFSTLSACILLFFTDYFLLQELCFQFFCLTFFIFGQRGSELKNKVLRVMSYQFLLVSLLESFEYFP